MACHKAVCCHHCFSCDQSVAARIWLAQSYVPPAIFSNFMCLCFVLCWPLVTYEISARATCESWLGTRVIYNESPKRMRVHWEAVVFSDVHVVNKKTLQHWSHVLFLTNMDWQRNPPVVVPSTIVLTRCVTSFHANFTLAADSLNFYLAVVQHTPPRSISQWR